MNQCNSFLLSNPTHEHLLETTHALLHSVQHDVRSRKVKPPKDLLLVYNQTEGVLQWNGGQPSKTDGGYSAGQTSRLGVAWWTDRDKNLHVRVEVDRAQVSNFSMQEIFGTTLHPFHIVFPKHDPTFCVRCRYEVPPGEGHWAGDDRFACDPCVEQDRYYVETGFLPSGRRKRR
jgi:hypothetical protein